MTCCPFVQALGRYKGETTALLGNLSNAANATNVDANGNTRNYLRTTAPFNIEELASLPHSARSATARTPTSRPASTRSSPRASTRS